MNIELYTVHYPDRDTAKLMYRQMLEYGKELGVLSCALETYLTRSKRTRNKMKIIIAVAAEKAQDLPSMLKCVEQTLKEHPLYAYLSFESTATPLSQIQWNLNVYNDDNFQKIFKRKREKG